MSCGPFVGQGGSGVVRIMTLLLLLLGFGSVAELVTLAVFVTVARAKLLTAYVEVIVADWFAPIDGMRHGNAVVQAPELETNVRPAGVGSLTTTFAALFGPALATTIVNVTFVPTLASPLT